MIIFLLLKALITCTNPDIDIHGIFISQAIKLEKETKDVKEEFQEFQEGSRELEAELETQLEQVLSKIYFDAIVIYEYNLR